MNPKFSVGDEVILVDLRGVWHDFNHVIIDYKYSHTIVGNSGSRNFREGNVYKVTNNPDWRGESLWIAEEHLRPKPKQDDNEAFERFMKKIDLTTNVPEEVSA